MSPGVTRPPVALEMGRQRDEQPNSPEPWSQGCEMMPRDLGFVMQSGEANLGVRGEFKEDPEFNDDKCLLF